MRIAPNRRLTLQRLQVNLLCVQVVSLRHRVWPKNCAQKLPKSVPKHVGVGKYEQIVCAGGVWQRNGRCLLPVFDAPLTSNSSSTLKSRTCLTSGALHSLPFAHSLSRTCLEPVCSRIKHRNVPARTPAGRQNHSMRRASALALVLRQLRPCQDTSSAAHRCEHEAWGGWWHLVAAASTPSSARPQPRVTRLVFVHAGCSSIARRGY